MESSMRDIGEVKTKLLGCPKMQPHASHGLKKKKKDLPTKKGIVKVLLPVSLPWSIGFLLVSLCTCVWSWTSYPRPSCLIWIKPSRQSRGQVIPFQIPAFLLIHSLVAASWRQKRSSCGSAVLEQEHCQTPKWKGQVFDIGKQWEGSSDLSADSGKVNRFPTCQGVSDLVSDRNI